MAYWFTADWHINHNNIIRYCKRPFGSSDQMTEFLIKAYNSRVAPNDNAFFIGDLAWTHDQEMVERLLSRLNGRKVLIPGNHDFKPTVNARGWDAVNPIFEISVPDGDGRQVIVLCHYAMRTWNKSHYGSWHLYGHSHGNLPDLDHVMATDVGVDRWGYRPVSYEEVKAILLPRQMAMKEQLADQGKLIRLSASMSNNEQEMKSEPGIEDFDEPDSDGVDWADGKFC